VLPTQSICLSVPIVPPSEHEELSAERQRSAARELRAVELAAQATGTIG
jgi:beta-glucosidase